VTSSERREREWRQFHLLSRDATRRLLNTALFSRDSDPVGFAVWMLALLSTPPAFYAVNQMLKFVMLRRAPYEVVERAVLGDRLFFVTYAMLAALLLASLVWEALFPDRAEQEIVGVLPVRPRILAAARLAAAIRLAFIFALAVSGPAAVIYTIAAASHPALRSMPQLLAGHLIGTTLGTLFVFLTLLCARGAMAITMGTRAGNWVAIALQLVAIISLVEVFFFLPAVLDYLVRAMLQGGEVVFLPPVWFAALFSWIGGDLRPSLIALAQLALTLAAASAAVVAPLYLLSASRVARRVMEVKERHGRARLSAIAGFMGSLTRQPPAVRGMFLFAVASLVRSRRHLLILSAYLSLGIATVIFRLVLASLYRPPSSGPPARLQSSIQLIFGNQPTAALLSVPLVLIFFLVFGLRASFRVPTDVDANWPFRLRPPRTADCAEATWLTLLFLSVLPAAALTLAAATAAWTVGTALAVAVVTVASGLVLIESVLMDWAVVLFTCEHAPTAETVKWKWIAFLVALNVFAFVLARFEASAVSSSTGTVLYLGVMVAAVMLLRMIRLRALRRRAVEFDETQQDGAVTLSLSEALR
jgi:hypothetical protein